jgi:hypothetical protein
MQLREASADVRIELHQGDSNRPVRTLAARWVFEGPDAYVETLRESVDGGAFVTLAAWRYERARDPGDAGGDAAADAGTARPTGRLAGLGAVVGRSWLGDLAGVGAVRVHFEWIPYVDMARILVLGRDGDGTPLFEAYVYEHPREGRLRVLGLSASGGVYDGGLEVPGDGVARAGVTGYEGSGAASLEALLEPGEAGEVVVRVWETDGGERRVLLELELVGE